MIIGSGGRQKKTPLLKPPIFFPPLAIDHSVTRLDEYKVIQRDIARWILLYAHISAPVDSGVDVFQDGAARRSLPYVRHSLTSRLGEIFFQRLVITPYATT